MPLMFCIVSKEVTLSALLTIQAAKEVFREKFGVELASRLGDGTLDGHPGLYEAAEVELTGLRVHRCLEHAKRNIGKHGRWWVAGNKTSMIQGLIGATAFFPSALLFHATWLRIYQRLGATEGGAAEPGMTKYMQKHQVRSCGQRRIVDRCVEDFVARGAAGVRRVCPEFFGILLESSGLLGAFA